jgi:MFS transporter, Spinster family, sphingosine-1-phosphate transporter
MTDTIAPRSAAFAPTKGLQARVLALLLLAYVFNFLDRQILSILKIPIKAELGLSDTQLGLMGGIARVE